MLITKHDIIHSELNFPVLSSWSYTSLLYAVSWVFWLLWWNQWVLFIIMMWIMCIFLIHCKKKGQAEMVVFNNLQHTYAVVALLGRNVGIGVWCYRVGIWCRGVRARGTCWVQQIVSKTICKKHILRCTELMFWISLYLMVIGPIFIWRCQ